MGKHNILKTLGLALTLPLMHFKNVITTCDVMLVQWLANLTRADLTTSCHIRGNLSIYLTDDNSRWEGYKDPSHYKSYRATKNGWKKIFFWYLFYALKGVFGYI